MLIFTGVSCFFFPDPFVSILRHVWKNDIHYLPTTSHLNSFLLVSQCMLDSKGVACLNIFQQSMELVL